MGGLDRWMQHSYPTSRIITINRTGVPMRGSPTTTSSSLSTELQYSPGSYSTVQDDRFHPEYEDPENVYEKPPEVGKDKKVLSPSPPPLPPPLNHNTLQKLVDDYTIRKYKNSLKKSKTKCGCRLYVLLLIFLLVAVILGLLAALVFVQSQNDQNLQVFQLRAGAPVPQTTNQSVLIPLENQGAAILAKRVTEPIISANTLLTYLITKRKICLFEVSTLQAEDSRQDFEDEHIESAHLLYFNNLSHSGVPVHPLQFQRYIRNQGVDTDCHIIVYDKGEQIWSSYAFWIFKLFGHERTSLLDGGFPIWKNLQEHKMGPYTTARGSNQFPEYVGNFQAKWTAEYISAFDDVVTNFDNKEHDIVDAQSPEEYDGTAPGAIFGHIQGAINIPPEEIFNAVNNTWFEKIEMAQIFTEKGLQITRPVIVYCGTSLHASMIWLALHRLKFNATVYFGSWPEWVIRAPDYLKVTPEGLETLPSSTENLRTTPESVKMSSIVPKAANLPKNPQ